MTLGLAIKKVTPSPDVATGPRRKRSDHASPGSAAFGPLERKQAVDDAQVLEALDQADKAAAAAEKPHDDSFSIPSREREGAVAPTSSPQQEQSVLFQ